MDVEISEDSERRDSVRHAVCDNRALVGWMAGEQLIETPARIKDISLRGARLELDQMPPSHITKVMMRLDQPTDCDWMDSVVAWCRMKSRDRGHEVGLTFENFLSYDVFSKLVSRRERSQPGSRRKKVKSTPDQDAARSGSARTGGAGGDAAEGQTPGKKDSQDGKPSTSKRRAKPDDPAKRPERRHSVRYKAECNHVWITWWDGEKHVTREGYFVNISTTGALFQPNESLPSDIKKVWVRLIFPDKSAWIEAEIIYWESITRDVPSLGIQFREPVDYGVFKHMVGCELDCRTERNLCPEFDTQYWR